MLLLFCAADGLNAYFSRDDFINLLYLHGLHTPVGRMLADVFNPLTSAYRPFGGLLYRLMDAAGRGHAFYFRAFCFSLLLLNVVIVWRLFLLLSNSLPTTFTAVCLWVYHPAMEELYYSSGTIYDLAGLSLCAGAFLVYAASRISGKIKIRAALLILLLQFLALQTKEWAVVLPMELFLFEWLLLKPQRFAWSKTANQAPSVWLPALLSCLSVGMTLHRILTPNPISMNPLYHPHLSMSYYLTAVAHYHNLLIYSSDFFDSFRVSILLIVLAAIGVFFKSREMVFGLLFWLIALIPVCSIPQRGGFVLYFPLLGMAFYFGTLIQILARVTLPASRFLAHALHLRAPGHKMLFMLPTLASFCVLFASSVVNLKHRAAETAELVKASDGLRAFSRNLRTAHPTLKSRSRVLFLHDPFRDPSLLPLAVRFAYRDTSISVSRISDHPHVDSYDYVMDTRPDLHVVDMPALRVNCSPTALPMSAAATADDSSPAICWEGAWESGLYPDAINSTLTFSDQKGSRASYAFEGTRFTYLYTKAPNRGLARITVEGSVRAVVDLCASGIVWRSSTEIQGLANAQHVAQIEVMGESRCPSKETFVDVDAFSTTETGHGN